MGTLPVKTPRAYLLRSRLHGTPYGQYGYTAGKTPWTYRLWSRLYGSPYGYTARENSVGLSD